MVGLLRVLLLFFGFLLVRRVWRSFTGGGKSQQRSAPRPDGPNSRVEPEARRDLGSGQPIEEADYEELD